MLHYDRIDISEGTDLAKSNNSKEGMNCLYFFSNHGCCVRDIDIINAKNVDYRCIIHNISKSEATKLLENSVLEDCGYI